MKTNWLYKNNREKCILFMNGWGCDEQPFSGITSKEYDVLMCYDYKDILLPREVESVFGSYQEVHLIAWSLGVYVANLVLNHRKELFASATAINGTLTPIDNLKGIPPAVFQGTIDGLNAKNLEKFQMRMCGGRNGYIKFKEHLPERTLEDQKEELIALQSIVQNHFVDWNVFNTALIGKKDLIFPYENLKSAWKDQVHVIEKEGFPHFCFYNWESWDDLMKEL